MPDPSWKKLIQNISGVGSFAKDYPLNIKQKTTDISFDNVLPTYDITKEKEKININTINFDNVLPDPTPFNFAPSKPNLIFKPRTDSKKSYPSVGNFSHSSPFISSAAHYNPLVSNFDAYLREEGTYQGASNRIDKDYFKKHNLDVIDLNSNDSVENGEELRKAKDALFDYWLPTYFKDAFNQSSQGAIHRIAQGEYKYKTGMSQWTEDPNSAPPPGVVYQGAVWAGSIVGSPTDIALSVGGWKLGTKVLWPVVKPLQKPTANWLVKKGILSEKLAKQFMADIMGPNAAGTTGWFATQMPFHHSAMEVADKVIQANQASNNNPLVYSPISEISYIGRVTKDTDEAMELIKAESLRRRLFKEGRSPLNLQIAIATKPDGKDFEWVVSGNRPDTKLFDFSELEKIENPNEKFRKATELVIKNIAVRDVLEGIALSQTFKVGRFAGRYVPWRTPTRPSGRTVGGPLSRLFFDKPLDTRRGWFQGMGGEFGTLALTSPLVYEGDMPGADNLSYAAGIVLASKMPAAVKNRIIAAMRKNRSTYTYNPMNLSKRELERVGYTFDERGNVRFWDTKTSKFILHEEKIVNGKVQWVPVKKPKTRVETQIEGAIETEKVGGVFRPKEQKLLEAGKPVKPEPVKKPPKKQKFEDIIVKKKPKTPTTDLLVLNEITPVELEKFIAAGTYVDRAVERLKAGYVMVQDPLAAINESFQFPKDNKALQSGIPIFQKDSNGNLNIVGYEPSEAELAIKVLNRHDLPGGMMTGDYMNTSIQGIPLEGGKTPSKIDEIFYAVNKKEIPRSSMPVIDLESMRFSKTGISFNIKAGRQNYALDEYNSDLFLKFYSQQPALQYNFWNANKDIVNSKFALTRIRRRVLRNLIRDGKEGINYSKKGDYFAAISAVAHSNKYEKWLPKINRATERRQKTGKGNYYPIKVQHMSEMEMKLVTQYMQDKIHIRRTSALIEEHYGGTLRHLSPHVPENEFSNTIGYIISESGNAITNPAARTTLGLIARLDRNIVQRSTEDLISLQLALGMDVNILGVTKTFIPTAISKALGYNPFRSELAEKWVTGQEITLYGNPKFPEGEVFKGAFNDYVGLGNAPKVFKKWQKELAEIEKDQKRKVKNRKYNYSTEELDFLRYRIRTFEAIKRIMDPILDRAIEAGIRVPGRKQWYLPYVMNKEWRDVIYSTMHDLERKVMAITKGKAVQADLSRAKLTKKQEEAFKAYMEKWIKGLEKSANKYERATASTWKLVRKEIEKDPRFSGELIDYDVFNAMRGSLYTESFKAYGHLEKKRTLGVSKSVNDVDIMQAIVKSKLDLLDKNILTLYTDYILGANKRIEMSRVFGPGGGLYYKLLDAIGDEEIARGLIPSISKLFGRPAGTAAHGHKADMFVRSQKDMIRIYMHLLSGESQYSRNSFIAQIQDPISSFVFTTKISLGTATVPNAFQLLISSITDLGIFSFLRGTTSYFTNPKVFDIVLRSGPGNLSLVDELQPGIKALGKSSERLMDVATPTGEYSQTVMMGLDSVTFTELAAKPFMYVNLWNKIASAAMAEDYIIKMTKVLSGKQSPGDKMELLFELPTVPIFNTMENYARNKIWYRFGLNPDELILHSDAVINRTFKTKEELKLKRKIMRALEGYAQYMQAGRMFELDSFANNDPNARSAALFKRWAKRQGYLSQDILEFEMSQGNYAIPLTLAAWAALGGTLSWKAIEYIKDTLSGSVKTPDGDIVKPEGYEKLMSEVKQLQDEAIKLRATEDPEDDKKSDELEERAYKLKQEAQALLVPSLQKHLGLETGIPRRHTDIRPPSIEDFREGNVTYDQIKEIYKRSGYIGMYGDFVLDNQFMDSFKFAVSPAVSTDMEAVGSTLVYYYGLLTDKYPDDDLNIAMRTTLKHLAPVGGSLINSLALRWEYEPWSYPEKGEEPVGMQKVPIQKWLNTEKERRKLVVEEIRNTIADSFLNGDSWTGAGGNEAYVDETIIFISPEDQKRFPSTVGRNRVYLNNAKKVHELVENWNTGPAAMQYPGLRITPKDFTNKKINELILERINKNREHYELKRTDVLPERLK